MVAGMDLNVSPQPEEDDETFEQQFEEEEYRIPETKHRHRSDHVDHVESAVDILRRVIDFPCLINSYILLSRCFIVV